MTNQGFSKLGYYALDRITDVVPSFAPKVFQKLFLGTFGSAFAYSLYLSKYRHQLLKTKNFDKILVVVDINIGDAVLLQNSIAAVRNYFPQAQIDYMCSQKGGQLLPRIPMADNVYNVFTSGGIPSVKDAEAVRDILVANDYSLILNFSPFVSKRILSYGANVLQMYIPMSAYILYLWHVKAEHMHISEIAYNFLGDFLKPLAKETNGAGLEIVRKSDIAVSKGNVVYLSHEDIHAAHEFLLSRDVFPFDRLLLFNPDVTMKFSMIPFSVQVRALKNILGSDDVDYALIASAYFKKGIENELLEALPAELRRKVIIVPYMSLGAFTALIDLCDVFLTGDTGPLHIAASRKKAANRTDELRNRTAVVSVIGPTDSRMFTYDSEKPGHMPAYQDAPSKVFVGEAPCRNVTCLNKTGKTCNEIRCFANIDPEKISSYIVSYFRYLNTPARKLG